MSLDPAVKVTAPPRQVLAAVRSRNPVRLTLGLMKPPLYAALLLTLSAYPQGTVDSPIPGWFLSGSNGKAYLMALDADSKHGGKSSGFIRCKEKHCDKFGTIM